MFRSAGIIVAAVLALPFVGCAGETETPPADAPPEGGAELMAGRVVYDDVCSACHTLQPPHDQAPPLTHIARRLRGELEDESAFVAHVVRHVANPTEEGSLLPAHAVERFGLMPAQDLTDEQLSSVAAWLWVMADSAQMGMDGEDHEMGEGGMGEGGMGRGGMGQGGMGEGHMGGRMGGGIGEGRMGGGGPPMPDTAH